MNCTILLQFVLRKTCCKHDLSFSIKPATPAQTHAIYQ